MLICGVISLRKIKFEWENQTKKEEKKENIFRFIFSFEYNFGMRQNIPYLHRPEDDLTKKLKCAYDL